MLRLDFVTLFPEMVLQALRHSITGRAEAEGKVAYGTSNPRDYTYDKHRSVDDKPFGGGAGMLIKAQPVAEALEAIQASRENPGTAIVLTDPTGLPFTQQAANELAQCERVVFLCGHYEGFDDRIRTELTTHVFSIGDFVLTNGELPALIMADAIIRRIPGVLGSQDSLDQDSHSDGLLSAPQYTKPEEWRGINVPAVLRGGNHKEIQQWKRRQALLQTRLHRPDLFALAHLDKKDLELLSEDGG